MFANPLVKKCSKCDYISSNTAKDFHKNKKSKDGLEAQCKTCRSKRGAVWRKNNKQRKRNTDIIYRNKKEVFIMDNYRGKIGKYRKVVKNKLHEEILKRYQVYYTREMFLEMVEEHEKKNGFVCEITGVQLTNKRFKNINNINERTLTNFSMDRLDPAIGYTKQNTVFVTWEFNDRKGAVTPKDCFLILKKYKERFPNEFNEFMKEFGKVFK